MKSLKAEAEYWESWILKLSYFYYKYGLSSMDTDNIVRRIIELKKVSVELKQSTENPSFTNTDFVKSILKLGR